MKSISTKLSVAMIACMLAAVALVSVIYTTQAQRINEQDSEQIIRLICDDSAKALDAQLVAIERSIDLLAQHSRSFLFDAEGRLIVENMDTFESICLSTALYTPETYSLYFHCNRYKYSQNHDFYYVLDPETGKLEKQHAYDPYAYKRDTGLDANWFFVSANSHESVWLPPYYHGNEGIGSGLAVATYTIPIMDPEGALFGVLGMDITLESLKCELEDISFYQTGYAFVVSADGTVILHPTLEYGQNMCEVDRSFESVVQRMQSGEVPDELFEYHFNGRDKMLIYRTLRNGTFLMATAPVEEINAAVNRMRSESMILFAVIVISSVILVYCIIHRFIRPLQLLTYASQEIMKGNLQVMLPYKSNDEIGELTNSFRRMTTYLQEHITHMDTIAHTDAMTGLKNKASYQSAVAVLQERIQQGFTNFGVVVFDLNNLKITNDSLGHSAGDKLIKNAGYVIGRAFAHSPVFRIGGDEFVAILENEDLRYYADCEDKLTLICEELNEQLPADEQVSLAHGMARYEPDRDADYRDVFARADKEMYRFKRRMKDRERAAAENTPEA